MSTSSDELYGIVTKDLAKDLDNYTNAEVRALAKQMGLNSGKNIKFEIGKRLALANMTDFPFSDVCSGNVTKTPQDINKLRKKVLKKWGNVDPVSLTEKQLESIVYMYDSMWFNGDLAAFFKRHGWSLDFSTVGDGFGIEGVCGGTVCMYTMTIPTSKFTNAKKGTIVAGISCDSPMDCVLRVLEHELIHLLIFTYCNEPYVSDQHSELFQGTAMRMFGHTDYTHHLTG